MQVHVRVLI